jgi:hypothetical protein
MTGSSSGGFSLIPPGTKIPGHVKQATVFIREAGLAGSGSSDLLGVDANGAIYIVECKLATNREVRRQVIGQIMEYGAFLWGMSFEEFDGLFVAREGKSLSELFSEKVVGEWSYESFRNAANENLQSGVFHLIIAVDAMNDELEQIVRYISHHGSAIRVQTLELRLYDAQDHEILVPQLSSQLESIEKAASPGKKSLQQVLSSCENDSVRILLQQFVDEWLKLGNLIEPGTKGLSFRAQVRDQERYVFWALNPNTFSAVFSRLESQGMPATLSEEYRQKLATMHGFDSSKVMDQSAPRANIKDLSKEDIHTLVQLHQGVVEKWRRIIDDL